MECDSSEPEPDIDKRRTELLELSSYIKTVDNDVTMILQSLQWDRKHLIKSSPKNLCRHDRNHKLPPDKLEAHEKECYVRSLGYTKEDVLLPEPLDANANTLVTLNKNDIENIIDYAAKVEPAFKKAWFTCRRILSWGMGSNWSAPLSLERLQHAFSTDERRALHDAVVNAVPACHDLNELALIGGENEGQNTKAKSRSEILAELRDMKRRRAKYRGAAKTRNYSDVLRGVIATQMEHYSEVQDKDSRKEIGNNHNSRAEKTKYSEMQEPIREIKKEPFEHDDRYYTNRNERRKTSKEHDREKPREDIRHNGELRHANRSRDKYRDQDRSQEEYKRDRHNMRNKDDRDRHSSSSKESRERQDYRNRDKHRDDLRRNDYKDYKSSRHTDFRHKDSKDKSHREEKQKRYCDYNQEYKVTNKHIKKEKD